MPTIDWRMTPQAVCDRFGFGAEGVCVFAARKMEKEGNKSAATEYHKLATACAAIMGQNPITDTKIRWWDIFKEGRSR